jgi:hypothetical protein
MVFLRLQRRRPYVPRWRAHVSRRRRIDHVLLARLLHHVGLAPPLPIMANKHRDPSSNQHEEHQDADDNAYYCTSRQADPPCDNNIRVASKITESRWSREIGWAAESAGRCEGEGGRGANGTEAGHGLPETRSKAADARG